MARTYKYLHFVSFQSLINWSVAHLLNRDLGFTKQYSFVKIGDLIHRSSGLITIKDDILYTQITLKTNGGGAVLRDKKLGKDIGTKKQYLAKEGQFIMSKIDARNGAFGVVSKELDNAIVTGDFPLFDVETERINPVYLYLLSATKPFVQYAQSCSRGTTNRQRIDIDAFLGLQIPLPSLEEQNKIVAAYNNALAKAEKCVKKSQNIDDQIEAYLQEVLGLSQTKTSTRQSAIGKFMWLVHLKNITRWDVYNSRSNNYDGIYDYVLLRDILVSHPKYGAGYKAEKKQRDVRYIRITDINEDGSLNDDFASVAKYDNQYLLKQDDFLIARTGNTVGKTFLYDESMGKAIYAGYLIKFELDTYKVNPQYLLAYTKSSVYKTWIKNNMRISAQPNINSKQYEESPIILPPLDIQNEIVVHITALRDEQKNLQLHASELRLQAQQQFEQTIFN